MTTNATWISILSSRCAAALQDACSVTYETYHKYTAWGDDERYEIASWIFDTLEPCTSDAE